MANIFQDFSSSAVFFWCSGDWILQCRTACYVIGCVVLLIIFRDVIFYIYRTFIAGRENCIEYCFWTGVGSVQSPEEEGLVSSLH